MTAITPTLPTTHVQANSRTVDLFSGTAIAWITFWLSAPSGFMLMALNWRQAGQRGEMVRSIAASVVASTVFIAAWLYGWSMLVTLALCIVNVVTLFFLKDEADRCRTRMIIAGNIANVRNALQGIGLALLLSLVMAVPAYVLLAMVGA